MSGERKTRRLFFALWPEESTRAALVLATRKAVRSSDGRPVSPANLHVTLAFLGSIPQTRMQRLIDAADPLRFAPFSLVLDQLEHWPKANLLCAVPGERPMQATELAEALRASLIRHEFVIDVKPWRPHVTLARSVIKPQGVGAISPVRWRADRFVLVQSETLPEGSRYTVLRHWMA